VRQRTPPAWHETALVLAAPAAPQRASAGTTRTARQRTNGGIGDHYAQSGQPCQAASSPVAYITAMPERKPPTAQPDVRPPGARRLTKRPTSTTTWNAAPAAIAKKSTASTSLPE